MQRQSAAACIESTKCGVLWGVRSERVGVLSCFGDSPRGTVQRCFPSQSSQAATEELVRAPSQHPTGHVAVSHPPGRHGGEVGPLPGPRRRGRGGSRLAGGPRHQHKGHAFPRGIVRLGNFSSHTTCARAAPGEFCGPGAPRHDSTAAGTTEEKPEGGGGTVLASQPFRQRHTHTQQGVLAARAVGRRGGYGRRTTRAVGCPRRRQLPRGPGAGAARGLIGAGCQARRLRHTEHTRT